MFRLLRAELMQMRRNAIFWIILLVMIIFSYVASEQYAWFPEILIGGQFYPFEGQMSGVLVFVLSIKEQAWMLFTAQIFAALFIGKDFSLRTVNYPLMAGNSRFRVMMAKVICYYIACLSISAVYPMVSCIRFGLPWFFNLTTEDVFMILQWCGARLLFDLHLFSYGLIAVFAFRGIILPMIVTWVCNYTALFTAMGIMASGPIENRNAGIGRVIIDIFFPGVYMHYHFYPELFDLTHTVLTVICSTGFIVACLVGSYLLFRRAELK